VNNPEIVLTSDKRRRRGGAKNTPSRRKDPGGAGGLRIHVASAANRTEIPQDRWERFYYVLNIEEFGKCGEGATESENLISSPT
jgi:hypothetical protein